MSLTNLEALLLKAKATLTVVVEESKQRCETEGKLIENCTGAHYYAGQLAMVQQVLTYINNGDATQ